MQRLFDRVIDYGPYTLGSGSNGLRQIRLCANTSYAKGKTKEIRNDQVPDTNVINVTPVSTKSVTAKEWYTIYEHNSGPHLIQVGLAEYNVYQRKDVGILWNMEGAEHHLCLAEYQLSLRYFIAATHHFGGLWTCQLLVRLDEKDGIDNAFDPSHAP